jgi:hypothetical protein
MVTDSLQDTETKGLKVGAKDTKSSALHFVPRLMSLEVAAAYCSVGYWTIRGLVQAGKLPVVEFPRADEEGESIRRVLLDREDLDKFVDGLLRHGRPE